MTEKEWLNCKNTNEMLNYLFTQCGATERKLILLSAAYCRCIWHLFPEPLRKTVETAELFADDKASEREVEAATREISENVYPTPEPNFLPLLNAVTYTAISRRQVMDGDFRFSDGNLLITGRAVLVGSARGFTLAAVFDSMNATDGREAATLARQELWNRSHALFHDVFGNPFRPVAFDPAWRTPTVTAVAQTIYAERRFDDLPILADSLEEAGCNNVDILDHCRSGGDHVRGCWAVDLVLGKG